MKAEGGRSVRDQLRYSKNPKAVPFINLFGDYLQTLEVRLSKINNYGCFTLAPINKRKKIATYAGELIKGKRQIAARLREQTAAGVMKIITLTEGLAIDASVGGDATAFINHSCRPNAFMRIVPGNQVMFFALRDIQAGEEITMNYRNPDILAADGCGCGAVDHDPP